MRGRMPEARNRRGLRPVLNIDPFCSPLPFSAPVVETGSLDAHYLVIGMRQALYP